MSPLKIVYVSESQTPLPNQVMDVFQILVCDTIERFSQMTETYTNIGVVIVDISQSEKYSEILRIASEKQPPVSLLVVYEDMSFERLTDLINEFGIAGVCNHANVENKLPSFLATELDKQYEKREG